MAPFVVAVGVFVATAFVAACAAPILERQHLADGSWQLTCRLAMDACVREVEQICKDKQYRILNASSETRRKDAPPFETEYHTSRLAFACGKLPEGVVPGAVVDAGLGSGRVCGSGDTRACVGPGACAGGQTCLADSSGFGPCDCGPAGKVGIEAGASATKMASQGLSSGSDAGSVDTGRP